jgi:hypothetical protein
VKNRRRILTIHSTKKMVESQGGAVRFTENAELSTVSRLRTSCTGLHFLNLLTTFFMGTSSLQPYLQ